MSPPFRVALSRDLLDSTGAPSFGAGPLAILDAHPVIHWEFMPEIVADITADDCARYDAIYIASPRVTADAVARSDCRVRLIARHGVGYDSVDVSAMTRTGVMVTNTPTAVRRPVATMAITLLLALAHRLPAKDHLTRTGRWHERTDYMGVGLTGRTVGLIGCGGIGREFLRMIRVFDMRVLVADPHVDAADVASRGATLVPLETVMQESDFIVVACLLDDGTRHLINADRLARMKPAAFLINVARGPIVDERALYEVLAAKRIGGAALDVFEEEPTPADNPILGLENVIVSPHALCWTDELFRAIAESGLQAVADVARQRVPDFLVDRTVLGHPRVRAWLGGAA